MTAPSINLLPPDQPKPRRAAIPLNRGLRWWSTEEEQGAEPMLSVFVSQRAFVRFCAHAGSDLDNEVGGWLIGRWRADRNSRKQYIVVESILQAPHVRQGSAFLTFTQDSQVAMYQALGERFPGKELVGWYHTHPRMGVFLSEYDTWLHQNFFPEHYQVALVIEPHTAVGGFFIRQPDGFLDPRRYYGFYELYYGRRRSIVHWRNIYLEPEVIPGG
jgi:proteasome lid subunit RPN8/RPN11